MTWFSVGRRDFLASALAAGTAFGLAIERAAAQGQKIVRVRGQPDIQSLDPGYTVGSEEIPIQHAVLPKLAVPVKTDGGWTWKPSNFVETVEQVDPTHIAFALKKGLPWSNGYGELTAEDVKYSFERILQSDWKDSWSSLDHVEVKDSHSGVIVLNKPFAPVFLLSITASVGTIVCKAAVEKLPDKKIGSEFPAQCGPYMMTEWVPKQRIVLKRNPDWPGPKPDVDEIQILIIEDDNAAEHAFDAEEVDLTELLSTTYTRLKDNMPAHAKLLTMPAIYNGWIGMNTENPKLSDIRVRKAIQRAIDMDSISQAAYGAAATPSHGVVTPGILGFRETSNYSHDPAAAKALLAEAGVSGLELEIRLLNQLAYVTAAEIVQANLADVGITLTITPMDSGPFWSMGQESQGDEWKKLELWIMSYRTQPDPSDAVQWFVKEQIGVWNWERWSDPEFEKLWQDGLVETDPEKRARFYVRMQEIMEDTGAYVWMPNTPLVFIHRDNIVPAFDSGQYKYYQGYKLV